jgi:[glutamine synthetase] adenylyltransferase / [glutamine synthetase]-adenylyl-L-tyrosine phosphorylase
MAHSMQKELTAGKIRKLLGTHSNFWARQLKVHPDDLKWLLTETAPPAVARSLQRLRQEWSQVSWSEKNVEETFESLRDIKRREMLRITVRDLGELASLEETVAELSNLADYCLQIGYAAVKREITAKYGETSAQFAIFGMGKLGGQELNYSSDIDLIFVYSEEGTVGRVTNHDYFARLAERLVQQFRAGHHDSCLFRVDLRLRPEGNSGPITRSLESYENYYAAFGEVWERMALQKARFVAGDEELGYEFVQHLQPFCFPKHLTASALDEIFMIKGRIEAEILKEGGIDRHVKLGRGGIREIEFAVQALQLLHGARHAFSQERGTLRSLQALQRLEMLRPQDAAALHSAYVFLRKLEHRLQMREDRQTHVVPADSETQEELAIGLGYKSLAEFKKEWKRHQTFVHEFFEGIVRPTGNAPNSVQILPDWGQPSEIRDQLLRDAGFLQIQEAAQTFNTLLRGPDYAHVSQRTRNLFEQLCPHVLRIASNLARPDFALQQFERFIEAYGSRASLYELLFSNPKMLELLLKLFDSSRFLTDVIVQQPAFLEMMAYEGLLTISRSREAMFEALQAESEPSLDQRLRLFKRAELLRIELREILGLTDSLEETSREISCLADACLQTAINAQVSAPRAASAKRGARKEKPTNEPICVIALGKYGGMELSYGADLDLLFVGNNPSLATQIIGNMSQEQQLGIVFKIDARLRPYGQDGPLIQPLEAYESYYRKRAALWEKQSLTRARVAAGDEKLGSEFLKMVDSIIYQKPLSVDQLDGILEMRSRIENERGDPQDPLRDFKTGSGGLIDLEFLAQIHQLALGSKEPTVRRGSTPSVFRALAKIDPDWTQDRVAETLDHYFWLRKLEAAVRRFHNAPVSQLPADHEEWATFAKQLKYKNTSSLEKELKNRRVKVRGIFKDATERLRTSHFLDTTT